jgi:hypothetical protein
VNVAHIQQIEGNTLKIKDKSVSVSATYKQNIALLFKGNE